MKQTLGNQLDLFEHSRDVMLRNDVLAALEQRNATAGCEALLRPTAEYSVDAFAPIPRVACCELA
ncbi:hypothetical protein D8I24_3463 (plasmid) [Cupriavidus necator H850]|uniref:hypothetical protein n=1 Tax=Cupriavidus necator TaxID=106590 RepID=UPI00129D871A|nr:hypothetical protein [Cupriavidus necator]KAI3602162.1 hypothetical protein D8I24_3463 [Cupriavidus necator H850]